MKDMTSSSFRRTMSNEGAKDRSVLLVLLWANSLHKESEYTTPPPERTSRPTHPDTRTHGETTRRGATRRFPRRTVRSRAFATSPRLATVGRSSRTRTVRCRSSILDRSRERDDADDADDVEDVKGDDACARDDGPGGGGSASAVSSRTRVGVVGVGGVRSRVHTRRRERRLRLRLR